MQRNIGTENISNIRSIDTESFCQPGAVNTLKVSNISSNNIREILNTEPSN